MPTDAGEALRWLHRHFDVSFENDPRLVNYPVPDGEPPKYAPYFVLYVTPKGEARFDWSIRAEGRDAAKVVSNVKRIIVGEANVN